MSRRAIRGGWIEYFKHLKKTTSKDILAKNKTGNWYTLYINGRKRRHRASAPGETHANITGQTRRSLSYKAFWHSASFGYGITEAAKAKTSEWGHHLEYGTPNFRMFPRPSIHNNVFGTRSLIEPLFHRAFAREVKRMEREAERKARTRKVTKR